MDKQNRKLTDTIKIVPAVILCLGPVFWLIESIADYAFQGGSFFQLLFLPKTPELLTRLFFIFITVFFAYIFKEFKKSDTRLRVSEKKCSTIFNETSDALVIADAEGNILDVNRRAEEFFGYFKEQFSHMKVMQLYPKQELARMAQAFEEVLRDKKEVVLETVCINKDDAMIPVEQREALIESIRGNGRPGILVSISARRGEEAVSPGVNCVDGIDTQQGRLNELAQELDDNKKRCWDLENALKEMRNRYTEESQHALEIRKQRDGALRLIDEKEREKKEFQAALTIARKSLLESQVPANGAKQSPEALKAVQEKEHDRIALEKALETAEHKYAEVLVKLSEGNKQLEEASRALQLKEAESKELQGTLERIEQKLLEGESRINLAHKQYDDALKIIQQKENELKKLEAALAGSGEANKGDQEYSKALEESRIERQQLVDTLKLESAKAEAQGRQLEETLKVLGQSKEEKRQLEESLKAAEQRCAQGSLRAAENELKLEALSQALGQKDVLLRSLEESLSQAKTSYDDEYSKLEREHKQLEDALSLVEQKEAARKQLEAALQEAHVKHSAELLKVSREHDQLEAALKTIEQKEAAWKQLESSLKELEQKHTAELVKINLEHKAQDEAISLKAQEQKAGEFKQFEVKLKDVEQKYQQEVIRSSEQQKQLEDALHAVEQKEAERQKIETALREIHQQQMSESSNTVNVQAYQDALKVIEQKELERKQLEAALQEAERRLKEEEEKAAAVAHQPQASAAGGVQSGGSLPGGVSLCQVASGISHQIIDPLSVVLNNVKVLKIKFAQKKEFSYAELKEQIGFIEESAVLCKNIISSLGSVSSGTKVSLQTMQLNDVIEKVYAIKNQEFKFKNIVFQKQLQQDVPPIMGDALLLQQVIFNIIANAKWAIEQRPQRDGGIIGLGTQYDKPMNKVILTVSDTGIGIKDTDIPRIFEPMFTTKKVEEGIGLGLSIVSDIIKAHQATINVESKDRQGAAFKILFPALPMPKGP